MVISEIFNPAHYGGTFFAWPPLIVAVCTLLVGLEVLVHEQLSRVSMAFAGLCLGGSVWLAAFAGVYLAKDPGIALWWGKVAEAGLLFTPSALFYFTLMVVRCFGEYRWSARLGLILSGISAGILINTDLFVTGLAYYPWGPHPRFGVWSVPFLVFLCPYYIASLVLYWKAYHRFPLGVQRYRLKTFFFAFCVGALGGIDFLASFGFSVFPVGYLPAYAAVVLLAQIIWVYRFPDITPAFAAGQIIDTLPSLLLVLDQDGSICIVNRMACDVLGRTEKELNGCPIQEVLGGFLSPEEMIALRAEKKPLEQELTFTGPEGFVRELSLIASVITDPQGHLVGIVCLGRDVTLRRQMEEALRKSKEELEQRVSERTAELKQEIAKRLETEEILRQQTIADSLTGLYNRRGFLSFAEERLQLARRERSGLLVFMVDLDSLKYINDTYGHTAGDESLIHAARLLKDTFRSSDIVGRIGGDEFAVVAIEDQDNTAPILAQRLQENVVIFNRDAKRPYRLGLSAGAVRMGFEDTLSLGQLLMQADAALYENKKRKSSPKEVNKVDF